MGLHGMRLIFPFPVLICGIRFRLFSANSHRALYAKMSYILTFLIIRRQIVVFLLKKAHGTEVEARNSEVLEKNKLITKSIISYERFS